MFAANTPVTLLATTADPDGTPADRVEYWLDGNKLEVNSYSNNGYYYYTAPQLTFAEGPHTLYAKVFDTANLSSNSKEISFTVVDTVPSVAITYPENGKVIAANTPVTLLATTADPDGTPVNRVEYWLDGEKLEVNSYSDGNYYYTAPQVIFVTGTHALYAKVFDSANQSSNSETITFTVTDGPIVIDEVAPTVSLVSPHIAQSMWVNAPMTLRACATDPDGTPVTRVEFYYIVDNQETLISTVTTQGNDRLYTGSWTPTTPGVYSLKARAFDAGGVGVSATSVSVTVLDVPPTVNVITPINADNVDVNTAITLRASATDPDGTPVTKVEFYVGNPNTLIATIITPGNDRLYSTSWTPTTPGTYEITARAYDANGGVVTSDIVVVVVLGIHSPSLSIVSPSNEEEVRLGTTLTIRAVATRPNGTPVAKVEYYIDNNPDTPIATIVTAGNDRLFTSSWTPTMVGTYEITARAYDSDNGVTTSEAVRITVNSVPLPTVSIITPYDGEIIQLHTAVTLRAAATIPNGNLVSKVEYYIVNNPDTWIATVTTLGNDRLYTATWTPPAVGTYAINARAYDAAGGITSSSVVSITVSAIPVPSATLVTPNDGDSMWINMPISLRASATIPDGTPVSKVEFYVGTDTIVPAATVTVLGNDKLFSSTWTPTMSGTYNVKAIAYDAIGRNITTDNVSIVVQDEKPTVTLVAPCKESMYLTNTSIQLSACATDPDGTPVTKVEFFDSIECQQMIGTPVTTTGSNRLYNINWIPTLPGTYHLRAKAYDRDGWSVSEPLEITIVDTWPIAHTSVVITTPEDNANILSPASITINAVVKNAQSTVSKVEFFNGITPLGTITEAPYNYNWQNVAVGKYYVTAKAYEASGAITSSTECCVNVNETSVVMINSPLNGATFTSIADITISTTVNNADGTISKVEFYNGTTPIGTVMNAPYTFIWKRVGCTALGSDYSLTAKAYNNLGVATTSNTVVVHVVPTDVLTGHGVLVQCFDGNDADLTKNNLIGEGTLPRISWNQDGEGWTDGNLKFTRTYDTNNYYVRMTGIIRPKFNESYDLKFSSSHKAKVEMREAHANLAWPVFDIAASSGTSILHTPQPLSASKEYLITVVYEKTDGVVANFQASWSSQSQGLEVIPQCNLLPNSLPVVSITKPSSRQVFTAPASVYMVATAIDDQDMLDTPLNLTHGMDIANSQFNIVPADGSANSSEINKWVKGVYWDNRNSFARYETTNDATLNVKPGDSKRQYTIKARVWDIRGAQKTSEPTTFLVRNNPGLGDGIYGEYSSVWGNTEYFSSSRRDSKVDFSWLPADKPGKTSSDSFIVHWIGKIKFPDFAAETGDSTNYNKDEIPYTFVVKTNGKVKAKIWKEGETLPARITIADDNNISTLTPDEIVQYISNVQIDPTKLYEIDITYREKDNGTKPFIQLWWESANQGLEVIPQQNLYAHWPLECYLAYPVGDSEVYNIKGSIDDQTATIAVQANVVWPTLHDPEEHHLTDLKAIVTKLGFNTVPNVTRTFPLCQSTGVENGSVGGDNFPEFDTKSLYYQNNSIPIDASSFGQDIAGWYQVDAMSTDSRDARYLSYETNGLERVKDQHDARYINVKLGEPTITLRRKGDISNSTTYNLEITDPVEIISILCEVKFDGNPYGNYAYSCPLKSNGDYFDYRGTVSVTSNNPGKYRIKVTATDKFNVQSTKYAEFTKTATPPVVYGPTIDELLRFPYNSDPVNMFTGEEHYSTTDISISSNDLPAVSFERYFNTAFAKSKYCAPGLGVAGTDASSGWSHNYDIFVTNSSNSPDSNGWRDLVLNLPSGAHEDLRIQDSGTLVSSQSATLIPPPCSQYIASGTGENSTKTWTSLTLTWADQSKWTFQPLGDTLALKQVTDQLGRSISLNWASDRRLMSVAPTENNNDAHLLLTLNYTNGLLSSVTDKVTDKKVEYTIPTGGNLSKVVAYGNSSEVVDYSRYCYDDKSNLTAILDRDPSAELAFNADTNAGWKQHVFEYTTIDAQPMITSEGEKDFNGVWKHKYVYQYNKDVNSDLDHNTVVTETDENNVVIAKCTYIMDAIGRDTGKADPIGNRDYVSYTDDRFPYFPTSTTSALGSKTITIYGYTGLPEKVVTSVPMANTDDTDISDGIVTTNTINYNSGPFGRVIRTQVSNGTAQLPETTFTYNNFGMVTSVTSPLPGTNNTVKQTSVISYNDHGDQLSVSGVNNAGESIVPTTEYNYGAIGVSRTVVQKDRFGHKTSETVYDSRGRVVTSTQYLPKIQANVWTSIVGGITEYQYNCADQVLRARTTYPTDMGQNSGVVNTYAYTGGPLKKVESYKGLNIDWSSQDAVLHTTEYTYDSYGNVVVTTTDGLTVTKKFDVLGRLLYMFDPNGKKTEYTYDQAGSGDSAGVNTKGRLVSTTYPDNSVTSIKSYAQDGKITQTLDANNIRTMYVYAGTGIDVQRGTRDKLVGVYQCNVNTPQVYLSTNYVYDGFGRCISTTDKEGTYSTVFDAAGEVKEQATQYVGKMAWRKEFTNNPNGSLKIMKLSVADEAHDVNKAIYTYQYDEYDRMSNASRPFALTRASSQWVYEVDGRLKSQDLWGVAKSSYNYNYQGQLKELVNEQVTSDPQAKAPTQRFNNIQYRNDGKLASFHTAFENEHAGSVRNGYFASDTTMLYDSNNRLANFNCPGLQTPQTFAYDANGNPTVFAGQPVGLSYGNSNELLVSGYPYDANGNPTTYKGQSLEYDMINRLTKYGTTFTAGYRSDGKRAWREVNGNRTYFLYDGDKLLAEISGADSTLQAFNTWGPTGLIARDTYDAAAAASNKWKTVAYLCDPLGNVSQRISVQNNLLLSTYQFDAYGNLIRNLNGYGVNVLDANGKPIIDTSDPYGYKGKYGYYNEPSIGLILCTNRYYDSSVGRWLTRDPIGYDGGMNLYAYCGDDPVGGVDPSGLQGKKFRQWQESVLHPNRRTYDYAGKRRSVRKPPEKGLDSMRDIQSLGLSPDDAYWGFVGQAIPNMFRPRWGEYTNTSKQLAYGYNRQDYHVRDTKTGDYYSHEGQYARGVATSSIGLGWSMGWVLNMYNEPLTTEEVQAVIQGPSLQVTYNVYGATIATVNTLDSHGEPISCIELGIGGPKPKPTPKNPGLSVDVQYSVGSDPVSVGR